MKKSNFVFCFLLLLIFSIPSFTGPLSVSAREAGFLHKPGLSDISLIDISPYTNPDSFQYLTPALRALNLRLADTVKACESRGVLARHVFQGAYGSGFLRENIVGNDLDYLMAVDLGRVKISEGNTGKAAHEMIDRIELYLNALYNVISTKRAPDLSVMKWQLLENGELKRRGELVGKLAASLDDIIAGKRHIVLLDSSYAVLVPNMLPADEGYIYENIGIKLVSDRIRYTDWMFAGLREFSVMLHFVFDLEVTNRAGHKQLLKNISFDPTFTPRGEVIDFMDSFLWTVPVGACSASFFMNEFRTNSERLIRSRPCRSLWMLSRCSQCLREGNRIKALKRLHQGFDWISPVFDNSLRAEINRFLKKHLQNKDALLCEEIAEMAQMVRVAVKKADLLSVYFHSGDINKVINRMLSDLSRLQKGYPEVFEGSKDELRKYMEQLQKIMVTYPDFSQQKTACELLYKIKDLARDCQGSLLPDTKEILRWKNCIARKLSDAGFRFLPVYGLPDGTLGVLKKDLRMVTTLDILNHTPDKIGAPAFKYRLISESEIPRITSAGHKKQRLSPCSMLCLRAVKSPKQVKNYEEMLDNLRNDMKLFGPCHIF